MAEKLPPDRKDYIHIPPHFMILDAKMANESGLPLHDPDPDTHFPFVMFGGTPYYRASINLAGARQSRWQRITRHLDHAADDCRWQALR